MPVLMAIQKYSNNLLISLIESGAGGALEARLLNSCFKEDLLSYLPLVPTKLPAIFQRFKAQRRRVVGVQCFALSIWHEHG